MARRTQSSAPAGYVSQAPDTGYEVEERLFAAWGRMSGADKIRRLSELNASLEGIALAGLRDLHPHASERELRLRLAARRYGRDLILEAFGFDADAPSGE